MRYATDMDKKSDMTHGKDSRFYKFKQTLKGKRMNYINNDGNKKVDLNIKSKKIKKDDKGRVIKDRENAEMDDESSSEEVDEELNTV